MDYYAEKINLDDEGEEYVEVTRQPFRPRVEILTSDLDGDKTYVELTRKQAKRLRKALKAALL